MSYILDALKKSDQERKHGEVPGLNSFQEQPKPPIATSRILLYVLIVAILINALIIGLWVSFRQDPETPVITEVPKKTAITSDAAEAGKTDTKSLKIQAEKSPATETATQASKELTTVQKTEDTGLTTIATEPGEVEEELADELRGEPTRTTFEKLPADIRNDLPILSIAAHYYAGKASSRMASINGRVMRQGQSVSDGLVLEEITRDGVVFRYRDYIFSMDVFVR